MKTLIYENTEVVLDDNIHGEKDLWLTPAAMSQIFKKDSSVIAKHIAKIYKDGEVDSGTWRETTRLGSGRNQSKTYKVREYSLDVMLSIGYKINGKVGVSFRRWANKVLGTFLREGIVVNPQAVVEQGVGEIVSIMSGFQKQLIQGKKGSTSDFNEVLEIIKEYGYSFSTLQQYDEKKFVLDGAEKNTKYVLDYDSSIKAIEILKKDLIKKGEATILFGQEKTPMSLGSILGNVFNVFSWGDAYPSLEEKASQLLYFIIKDHPFNDGNKRTASFLFTLFLKKNDFHLKSNGEYKINDNALAILVLLIAESDPKERDTYIKLLVNMLRNR